ncbi:XTP/dITP diphosphohydrolase [Paenibacillus sp. UNCCL117]|uniref:XTP/dITP diphosphatase n=1 Tax=unclassified Paenibacillus TaxID=185978 RepID=UPI00089086FB|nr:MULTISPECIES: XTP/dITP diphosphatase [unclassified Paenibacillus]SDD26058.1 XTP/dITP diphosphohydrolase [Paenibacillus sp. cl123]SFW41163.1 XTP/dITP diphosphohydrolase [Paenibacillus sp. UNCCL117]
MRLLGHKTEEVVIATTNAGKVKEFAAMFGEDGTKVKSLKDYPDIPDIPEDGDTFAANALIKARAVARILGVPVIADDSGLAVDRLGGAPGVYSARYAGEPSNDAANNRKLLAELGKLERVVPAPDKGGDGPVTLSGAQFLCAIALVDAAGEPIAQVEGACRGAIIGEQRGEGGFGYDPLFYLPQLGKTMAELTMEEKNAISHRGQALRLLQTVLKQADQA